jgi:hypothetical protein
MDLFKRGIKDPVAATARVIALAPTAKAARQEGKLDVEYELDLEVTAPGHGVYAVSLTDTVPHDKTPIVGQALSVTASASDPQRVEVDWERAPDLATRMRASGDAARAGDPGAAARALGFELKDPGA